MEDHAIKPLEDVAEQYAEIRDERMELTEREHEVKVLALKLMHKYGKTIYRHNGVEITLIPGEEDVKVRVKKASDDEDGVKITDGEFGAARREAVNSSD